MEDVPRVSTLEDNNDVFDYSEDQEAYQPRSGTDKPVSQRIKNTESFSSSINFDDDQVETAAYHKR